MEAMEQAEVSAAAAAAVAAVAADAGAAATLGGYSSSAGAPPALPRAGSAFAALEPGPSLVMPPARKRRKTADDESDADSCEEAAGADYAGQGAERSSKRLRGRGALPTVAAELALDAAAAAEEEVRRQQPAETVPKEAALLAGEEMYCACGGGDEGFLVECADGSGGCNGWFHPSCSNLVLTDEQMQDMSRFSFTCSLCSKKQHTRGPRANKKGKQTAAAAAAAAASVLGEQDNADAGASAGAAAAGMAPSRGATFALPPTLHSNANDFGGSEAGRSSSYTGKQTQAQVSSVPDDDATAAAAPGSGGRSLGRGRRSSAGRGGRGGGRSSSRANSGGGGDDSDSADAGNDRPAVAGANGGRSARGGAAAKGRVGARGRRQVRYRDTDSEPEREAVASSDDDVSSGVAGGGGGSGSSASAKKKQKAKPARQAMPPPQLGAAGGAVPTSKGVAGLNGPPPREHNLVVERILGRKLIATSEVDDGKEGSNGGSGAKAKVEGGDGSVAAGTAAAAAAAGKGGKEGEVREMYYIKWKGLSYLRASWEYAEDLLRVDPTAKLKLKKYGAAMEAAHGANWRKSIDAEDEALAGERSYFESDLGEIQRVLACEAPFVRHEALLREERRKLLSGEAEADNDGDDVPAAADGVKEADDGMRAAAATTAADSTAAAATGSNSREDFPDGDVRYLVKFSGLPYDQCSWEPARDIAWASDQILAFWDHERPSPDLLAEAAAASEIAAAEAAAKAGGEQTAAARGFRPVRLLKSPVYGVSRAEREAGVDVTGGDPTAAGGLVVREYQLEGINWLLWNFQHRRPSILADEMGLGKTIQTTAFLHALWEGRCGRRCRGPFLVVAPLSLVAQWQAEVGAWSPDMNIVVYHGSSDSRAVIRRREFYHDPEVAATARVGGRGGGDKDPVAVLRRAGAVKFNVMVTTYEVAIKDIKELARINWEVLVVDEAHRLKNPASRLFQELLSLPRYHCLLLTGTPLQNRTEELWALLHFCDSDRFADQGSFMEKFGDLKDAEQVAELHATLKPYLLRRIKEDVEKSLPPKEETIVEVSLTPVQRQFYRAIYEKNTSFLFKGAKASNAPSLMNVMMELRKCCNHPYLNRGVEDRILSEIPPELHTKANLHKQLVDASGKMVLLSKLLPRLKEEGHKVLIFSQMVRCLDIIEDFIKGCNYKYERLDGSTRSNLRTAAVERFNRPVHNRFIMLLSTRAGGLGLNLTSADTVIIFDSDWNPHNDLQAQARAHRIGQTKSVMVYRLLTKKTYEMHMFHMASLKLGLDKAVLAHARSQADNDDGNGSVGGLGPSGGKFELAADEIDNLLKRGAYDVFREEDEEANSFVEADIDAIMQRASHKVTYGDRNGASGDRLSSSFSKASFVSTDHKDEISLDDPDFWRKAIGLVEETPDPSLMPAEQMGRQRRQASMYEPYSHLAGLDGAVDVSASDSEDGGTKGRKGGKGKGRGRGGPGGANRWGIHNRDRLVRALLAFGFGRWPRIQKEAGLTNRTVEQIEGFVRSYIYQAALCAANEKSLLEAREDGGGSAAVAEESQFVQDAIERSLQIRQETAKDPENALEVPEVLLEEKFVEKLTVQGLGRRALQRLDALQRLHALLLAAMEATVAEAPPLPAAVVAAAAGQRGRWGGGGGPNSMLENGEDRGAELEGEVTAAMALERAGTDLDDKVEALVPFGLAQRLDLGKERLKWTRLTPWWDLEADRDLVLGTFLDGLGENGRIRHDSRLCFERKMRAFNTAAAAATVARQTAAASAASEAESMAAESAGSRVDGDTPVQGRIRSRYRGVYSQPGSASWIAIAPKGTADGAESCVGSFATEKEAARAYDKALRRAGMAAASLGTAAAVATARERAASAAAWAASDPSAAEAAALAAAEAEAAELAAQAHGRNILAAAENATNFTAQEGRRRRSVNGRSNNSVLPWVRPSRFFGVRGVGHSWSARIAAPGGGSGGGSNGAPLNHLGNYATEASAAAAYDAAAHRHNAVAPQRRDGTRLGLLDLNFATEADYAAEETRILHFEKGFNRHGDPVPRWRLAALPMPPPGHGFGESPNEEREESDGDLSVGDCADASTADGGVGDAAGGGAAGASVDGSAWGRDPAAAEGAVATWPDTRVLNKLLIWLLCSGEATMNAEELLEVEKDSATRAAAAASAVRSKTKASGGAAKRRPPAPGGVVVVSGTGGMDGGLSGISGGLGGSGGKGQRSRTSMGSEGGRRGSGKKRPRDSLGNGDGDGDVDADMDDGSDGDGDNVGIGGGGFGGGGVGATGEYQQYPQADDFRGRSRRAFSGLGLVPGLDPRIAAFASGPINGDAASVAEAAAAAPARLVAVQTCLLEAWAVYYVQFWAEAGGDAGGRQLADWRLAHAEAVAALPPLRERKPGRVKKEDGNGDGIDDDSGAEGEEAFGSSDSGSVDDEGVSQARQWSLRDRKVLCAGLLARGAPGGGVEDTVDPSAWALMAGRSAEDAAAAGLAGDAAALAAEAMAPGMPSSYRWEDLLRQAGVDASPVAAARYYVEKFLPLCVELCHPSAVPSRPIAKEEEDDEDDAEEGGGGGDGGSSAARRVSPAEPPSFFPDPLRPVSEHSSAARGVAYTFLRRQQLLRACRYVLAKRLPALAAWAVGPSAWPPPPPVERELPLWWCPWVHDVALLLGSVRHGLFAAAPMRADPTLPLRPAAIATHVRRAFLRPPRWHGDGAGGNDAKGGSSGGVVNGSGGIEESPSSAAAYSVAGLFPADAEGVSAWADAVAQQFPGRRCLEDRAFAVVEEMTRNMPLGHPLRLLQPQRTQQTHHGR